jgi:hypothetical protein
VTLIANESKETRETALSQARLKEVVNYDPLTGILTWLSTRGRCVYGSEAGTIRWNGYKRVQIDSRTYAVHRLIWLYVYGEWPEEDLDHIDADRSNNRVDNLRLASRSQNLMNRDKSPRNTSGYKGVSLDKKRNKWDARITAYGRQHCLGLFDNKLDAYKAYCAKEKELFGSYIREREDNGYTQTNQ